MPDTHPQAALPPATVEGLMELVNDLVCGNEAAAAVEAYARRLADATYEPELRKVLDVIQRYLPPDGITMTETIGEIIGVVDPWPAPSRLAERQILTRCALMTSCECRIGECKADALETERPEPQYSYTERPEETGVGEWCAPGPTKDQQRIWLLRFEDQDRAECHYADEAEARTAFASSEAHGWNCHLFATAPRAERPLPQAGAECRTDGRCQYAIDHGAEGLGHCPKGKCAMPAPPAQAGLTDAQIDEIQREYMQGQCDPRRFARMIERALRDGGRG